MRLCVFVVVISLAVIPVLSLSEVIHLKDGSTMRGRLIAIAGDTLLFETSFGSKIKVPRDALLRIDFGSPESQTSIGKGRLGAGALESAANDPSHVSSVAGTLSVSFEDFSLSSTISVHRDKDREGHAHDNSIEQFLLVDDERFFSYVDSLTDKVIRKGVEVRLKNEIKPQDFTVVLDPGLYACTVRFANTRADQYADKFVGEPLEKSLHKTDLNIRSGKTTQLRIELKRKKLGLGGSHLQEIYR